MRRLVLRVGERDLAQLDAVAVLQAALEHPEPVDERAVAAPEVHDEGPAGLDVEAGVLPGQAGVDDDDVVVARPADRIRARLQGVALFEGSTPGFLTSVGIDG